MRQEIVQVGTVLVGGQLVQIEQALLHHPRHVPGAFRGFQAALPLAAVRPPDISQVDPPPSGSAASSMSGLASTPLSTVSSLDCLKKVAKCFKAWSRQSKQKTVDR